MDQDTTDKDHEAHRAEVDPDNQACWRCLGYGDDGNGDTCPACHGTGDAQPGQA